MNCRHFVSPTISNPILSGGKFGICKHPKIGPLEQNPINGNIIYNSAQYNRGGSDLGAIIFRGCGPRGRKWEPK